MSHNYLYPIFLKLNNLSVLIVGGGAVALEKISFLLKSSPNANVKLVAPEFLPEIQDMDESGKVQLKYRDFLKRDLSGVDILIVATNDLSVNAKIYELAKSKGILTNVADTPEFCDFYLGSIVSKGNLKIAISTNGKSPTFAKRIRELLEDLIPENINETLDILNLYRAQLKTDFKNKVKELNRVTSTLLDSKP